MNKTRYAQVGVGSRASMYYEALHTQYQGTCEMVAFCDISQSRMDYANSIITEQLGGKALACYNYVDFDRMIAETRPDTVIITSIDRTHHEYIIRAMELGCDVIVEKPLTIDEKKAQAIIDAQKRTGRDIRVTFNYRYAPNSTKVKELLQDGVIGPVFSVHFEWLLNTSHGADYYRRWHRNKTNSGGLLVHKSTHHFDLVNFWLDAIPETVFAFGERNFYGKENAEKRGVKDFYYRCHGSEAAKDDPFAIDLESNDNFRKMYLEAEADSGYLRDRSVFGDDISIEDTMGVIVQYNTNAILTYSLNSYMPWEGFVVNFNGERGRIEYRVREQSYINGAGNREGEGSLLAKEIVVYPMFGEPYSVDYETPKGGHGGGDTLMLDDIFLPEKKADRFHRAANHIDGCMSILTGVAANKAIATKRPISVKDLIQL